MRVAAKWPGFIKALNHQWRLFEVLSCDSCRLFGYCMRREAPYVRLTPQKITAAMDVLTIVAAECLLDQGHAKDLCIYVEAKNLLSQRLLAKECEIAVARPTMTALEPPVGSCRFGHARADINGLF